MLPPLSSPQIKKWGKSADLQRYKCKNTECGKTFTKQENIAHRRLITLSKKRVIGKEFPIQNVNNYISRLKTWLVRFNEFGTDYLAHYLGWRRLFETSEVSTCNWLKLAMGINNS
jgi:hypothetical protein